ncbi:MAG: PLP-dependent aminotransferase family protein, partial [Bacteroidota bacterium]
QLMTYHQAYQGDIQLRRALAKYLTETRGIHVEVSNILITRGSLMAFYLLFQNLLSPGDKVIVGNPGFNEAHNSIRLAQGQLVRVAVDEEGMDVDAVERICEKERIRAVYIVPHHHYPTTVALSAERRMRLLLLAERYGFAIIEDDYDYDFHYSSSPVLPMASSDYAGTVAYVGSFSKTIAPSLRIGFIVAPEALIQALTKFSRFVDSHGNTALERAVAMLFANGEINRHLKKATTIYRNRRDHCCAMLQKELGPFIDFNVPEGGLAVWVKFKPPLSIQQLHQKAAQIGLRFPDTHLFCPPNETLNATRIGFASRTPEEMTNAIKLLQQLTKITSKPNKITN